MMNDSLTPSDLFDFGDWSLTLPISNDDDGYADQVSQEQLSGSYESDYFYATADGGVVFYTPHSDVTTAGSSAPRTELREMLRRGNTEIQSRGITENNWVLSSASESSRDAAGGVDGLLTATLAINQVSESSSSPTIVIGQIHGEGKPPLLLAYRKHVNNSKGSLYFGVNDSGGQGQVFNLIGDRHSSENPEDGIALDEKFTYQIEARGDEFTVRILREDKPDVSQVIDISDFGYGSSDAWMFFKSGVYFADSDSQEGDIAQATFYALENTHEGYSPNYDDIDLEPTIIDNSQFGNEDNDFLTGNSNDNFLDGKNGSDTLRGGDGDDSLRGGLENDSLSGEFGNDFLEGELGDDSIYGGSGSDIAMGGAGNDLLSGHSGDDFLEGNNGNDVINGGIGIDTLTGGLGRDTLNGGSGSDTYKFNSLDDSLFSNPDRVRGHDYADVFDLTSLNFSGFEFDATGNTANLDADILRYYHRTTGSGEVRTFVVDDSSDFAFYVVGEKTFYSNDFEF